MKLAAWLLFATLAAGCRESPAIAASANSQAVGDTDLRRIVKKVSAARKLAERRPVRIEQLSSEQFAHELAVMIEQDRKSTGDDGIRRAGGVLIGFDLVPPPEKRASLSKMDDVLQEQVAGFYDPDRDSVFVRIPGREDNEIEWKATVAHEIHHALQHQHFEFKLGVGTHDSALALKALVEGDAMVAAGAYLGAEYGAPVRRTIIMLSDIITKNMNVEAVARGEANHLSRALPLAREQLMFPYVSGMSFVADLYRAGGFALVDRAYQHPPVSTSQILHPEKYIAGVLPAEIGELSLPSGHEALADGSLGELQTRVVLSRCVARDRAASAAKGLAGDRYLAAVSPKGELAMLWLTSWDDEAWAHGFETIMGGCNASWTNNKLDDKGALTVTSTVQLKRLGAEVALVRGLPAKLADSTLKALLAVSVKRPAPQPIGDFTIPPRARLPEPRRGELHGDVHTNTWFGIRGSIPHELTPKLTKNPLAADEIVVSNESRGAFGLLGLSDRIHDDEYNGKAVDTVIEILEDKGHTNLIRVGAGRRNLPLGPALEERWRVQGGTAEVRIILMPVCAGTGSLVFVLVYRNDDALRLLEPWLDSYNFISGRSVPMCDRLDPK